MTSYLLLPLDKQWNKPFQTLKPENLTWEKVISADYIVNYELLSAEMASSEARLKMLSNKVRFVLFCPVLLKKSRKNEATN